ncbi:MAG: hypothetical protein K2I07_02460 [Lachnospiraceae bacterium]|nr:hypothetical protein [Lachnospiraceae bacterium]
MRKGKWFTRLFLGLFIIIIIIMDQGLSVVPACAQEAELPTVDMTLTVELEQAVDVLNYFFNENARSIAYNNLQDVADEYIPEGAKCTDVSVIGEVVYIDYQLDGIRYLIAYYSDGSVEKVARPIGGDDMYSVDSIHNSVEHVNLKETLRTVEISDEEATRRMNEMMRNQMDENAVYPLENDMGRASGKTVYPLSYTSVSGTAPYKAKIVATGDVTISAFSGTSYSTSQPYRVYETMSYHSEVTKKTQAFAVGATLTKIATAFIVPTNTAKAWLTAAGVALSSANTLQEACEVVDENAYTYLGGKECGIYDPTQNNAYVETYSTWSQGKIVMTWDYNSSTGYRNPAWGHSVRSTSLQTANTTVRDAGRDAYNGNILTHGEWRWGVGNGFGY